MTWFWRHGNELFILFLFPAIGLFIDALLSKKATLSILIICCVLLSPIVFSYKYTIPGAYQLFGLMALGCIYSFISRYVESDRSKIATAVTSSLLLFFILGWFAFMDSFASGKQVIMKRWIKGAYLIDYRSDQGFAGGPSMYYELSKYGFVSILVKQIDVKADDSKGEDCVIRFTDNKIIFNKCNGELKGNL